MTHIEITIDSNDADYNTKLTEITSEELDRFTPLIDAIREFKPYRCGIFEHSHNFPMGEYLPREDLGEKYPKEIYSHIDPEIIEDFCDRLPPDVHTIEEINVLTIIDKKKLL